MPRTLAESILLNWIALIIFEQDEHPCRLERFGGSWTSLSPKLLSIGQLHGFCSRETRRGQLCLVGCLSLPQFPGPFPRWEAYVPFPSDASHMGTTKRDFHVITVIPVHLVLLAPFRSGCWTFISLAMGSKFLLNMSYLRCYTWQGQAMRGTVARPQQ